MNSNNVKSKFSHNISKNLQSILPEIPNDRNSNISVTISHIADNNILVHLTENNSVKKNKLRERLAAGASTNENDKTKICCTSEDHGPCCNLYRTMFGPTTDESILLGIETIKNLCGYSSGEVTEKTEDKGKIGESPRRSIESAASKKSPRRSIESTSSKKEDMKPKVGSPRGSIEIKKEEAEKKSESLSFTKDKGASTEGSLIKKEAAERPRRSSSIKKEHDETSRHSADRNSLKQQMPAIKEEPMDEVKFEIAQNEYETPKRTEKSPKRKVKPSSEKDEAPTETLGKGKARSSVDKEVIDEEAGMKAIPKQKRYQTAEIKKPKECDDMHCDGRMIQFSTTCSCSSKGTPATLEPALHLDSERESFSSTTTSSTTSSDTSLNANNKNFKNVQNNLCSCERTTNYFPSAMVFPSGQVFMPTFLPIDTISEKPSKAGQRTIKEEKEKGKKKSGKGCCSICKKRSESETSSHEYMKLDSNNDENIEKFEPNEGEFKPDKSSKFKPVKRAESEPDKKSKFKPYKNVDDYDRNIGENTQYLRSSEIERTVLKERYESSPTGTSISRSWQQKTETTLLDSYCSLDPKYEYEMAQQRKQLLTPTSSIRSQQTPSIKSEHTSRYSRETITSKCDCPQCIDCDTSFTSSMVFGRDEESPTARNVLADCTCKDVGTAALESSIEEGKDEQEFDSDSDLPAVPTDSIGSEQSPTEYTGITAETITTTISTRSGCCQTCIDEDISKGKDVSFSSKSHENGDIMKKDPKYKKRNIKYGVTRVTTYNDFTTYEILKMTKAKPKHVPATTENIFIVKNTEITK